MPRAKPAVAATFQLASADAQIVQPAKTKQAAAGRKRPKRNRKRRPTSSMPAASGATPPRRRNRQRRRRSPPSAPARRWPPPTRNRPPAFPPRSMRWPMRRPPIHRSTAPISSRPARRSPAASARHRSPRNPVAATEIDTVVAKGPQGQGSVVATSTRLAASASNDVWMRVMMLAPSASTSMSATVLGDADMTLMRVLFRQAAGRDRDELLGRSADGTGQRPLHRIGNRDRWRRNPSCCGPHRCAELRQARHTLGTSASSWRIAIAQLRQ